MIGLYSPTEIVEEQHDEQVCADLPPSVSDRDVRHWLVLLSGTGVRQISIGSG